MLNDMIQIRDKSRPAHREDADGVFKALVITIKFSLRSPEDREIPVTEEFHREPQDQHGEQYPSSRRPQNIEENKSRAVCTERDKLRAFNTHSLHKNVFTDLICSCASEKPDPQR